MDLTNVLNTIRDNASQMYQDRIPEATKTNITQVQEAMTDPNNAVVVNEFMNTLLNVLIKQVIHNKLFSNPLKALKRGKKPLGDTIEEIYANFLKAEAFDPTGADLLARKLPDVKTVFHRMNRKDKYKITVSPEMLAKAFSSYEKLGAFIQSIINSLYNSSELDEFILTKQLIKDALDNNAMKVVEIEDPIGDEAKGKAFIRAVKTVSGDMTFPNSNNNAYLTAQSTDTKPIITFSRPSEQVLILDNATNVSVNIDVLASIFNMSVAEFNETRKIVIDAFPDPTIRGAIVDEQFFQIYDDLIYFTNFRNPEGLYDNYYLHIWQTLSYSILVNAVCFKVSSDSSYSKVIISKQSVTTSGKDPAPSTTVSLANAITEAPALLKVNFNGREYKCEKQAGIGADHYGGSVVDFGDYPFSLNISQPTMQGDTITQATLYTPSAGTFTISAGI